MNVPKVSVCVVTYNHARYIRDCLMSVLAQVEDVSLEILVGDDLSEDKTGEIVKTLAEKYPRVIHYFRHAARKGPAGNYQFLIRKACGEYIAHLDGDDFWLPGKLKRQLAILEKSPDLVAVYSNAIVVDDDIVLKGVFNRAIPETFDLGFLLRNGNFICHASLIYRAKIKERLLNIITPFIDYQIHIQLAQQGTLGYVNCVLVGYRVASSTSMSVLQADHVRDLYWQALLSVENSPPLSKDLGLAMTHFIYMSSRDFFCNGQFSKIPPLWNKILPVLPVSKPFFLFHFLGFILKRLKFQFGELITKKLLKRPLKIYFER